MWQLKYAPGTSSTQAPSTHGGQPTEIRHNCTRAWTIVPGHLSSFRLLTRALLSRFSVVSFAEYVRWYDSLSLQSKQERYNWNSMQATIWQLMLKIYVVVNGPESCVKCLERFPGWRRCQYIIPYFWYQIHHPKYRINHLKLQIRHPKWQIR